MVYRYAVQINYANGGGPGFNIWHFRSTGTNDVQGCINAIKDFYTPILSHYQQSLTVVGPTEATAGIESGSPTFQAVTGFTATSTATGGAAAPVLQAVVGWRTTSATRSGRGRTFVGPFHPGAIQTDGTPSSTLVTNLNAAGQSVVDFNSGFGNGAIGVWSPTQNVLRDITGRRVRDIFAVLRSRRD
jgi:hypothetical protein